MQKTIDVKNGIKIFETLNLKIELLEFEKRKVEKQLDMITKTNLEYIHQLNRYNETINQLRESGTSRIETQFLQTRIKILKHQQQKNNKTMESVQKTNVSYIKQITIKNQKIEDLIKKIEQKDYDIIMLNQKLNKCSCKKKTEIISTLKLNLKSAEKKIESLQKELHYIKSKKQTVKDSLQKENQSVCLSSERCEACVWHESANRII